MDVINLSRRSLSADFYQPNTQLPSPTSLNAKPSQRLQRPRHREIQWREDLVARHQTPPEEPVMRRQRSGGRLLDIFTRAKSTKRAKPIVDSGGEGDLGFLAQDNHASVTVPGTGSLQDGHGAMLERSLTEEPIKQQPLMTKRSKSFKKDPAATKSIPWDPPPLFQAYPQSIKHVTVPAPAMSADAILRYQNDKKRKSKKRDTSREARGSNTNLDEDEERGDRGDGLQLGEWGPKTYVLVTSGYFLQYAGEGSFDRLPEKIMPIGKDSAAFASDAVPGKHWVLQVSHALDENSNPKIDTSWSFLKRFGLRGDLKRCSASNFLLVMDDPKELDAWLCVVRKEIESWGGQRYHQAATTRPSDEEAARTLQQTTSRRYKVMRNPNQFSNDVQETTATSGEAIAEDFPPPPGRKYSATTQNSVHYSRSTSHETASSDHHILDRLRNSPRMSYVSTGVKTYATSRDSSPVPSPVKPTFRLSGFDFSHEPLLMEDRAATTSSQALCQDCPQKPLDHALSSGFPRPPSTSRPSQTSSSGAPNFSVPSFSQRYSSAHSTPPLSTTSSSSASNLPRSSMSPPASSERYDPPLDFSPPVPEKYNQGRTTFKNSAAYSKDPGVLLLEEPELTVTDPIANPSAEWAVPRRFSSLEYSRAISLASPYPSPNPSPHPAPTSALPALPESSNNTLSAPVRKLRRPISMQVHTSSSATSTSSQPLPTISSPNIDEPTLSLPPPSRAPPPPPSLTDSNSLDAPSMPNRIQNRRSMPHLSRPPYDPPNCPLPTPPVPKLPLIKLSSGSLR